LKSKKNKNASVGLLNFRNLNTTLVFFFEDKDIQGDFKLNNLYESTFSGGKENELFREFKDGIQRFDTRKTELQEAMNEARRNMSNQDIVQLQTEAAMLTNEEQVFKKQFVDNNINSIIAMMMLNEMISKKEVNIKEVESYLAKRSPNAGDNVFSRLVTINMEMLRSADVGNMAPDFSGPDPNGNIISLKDAMGKVTLIDFWASWCRPCRIENPNVVRVHNQYKDKGFNIISVSLDRQDQRAQWLKAIEDDKMDWYHISNLQFWNDPIAREYGVRAIPATYILDETGRIVAKDLRGAALGKKVGQLLGEL
jgi:thiol-disulfide isomerase/thioredoxin